MTEPESIRGRSNTGSLANNQAWDIEQVAEALGVAAKSRINDAWGVGAVFRLGEVQPLEIELYPDTRAVRVTGRDMQISLFRQDRPPVKAPEGGVAFELNGTPAGRFLSVSPRGEVLFQYDPGTPVPSHQEPPQQAIFQPQPRPQAAEAKEKKPTSEKYVGRMGEVKTHFTKAGKRVAEVELTVPDPDRPGASRLIKFAAFDLMAEVLERNYQPGQVVTAVGIPHELKRRTKDGQEYVERQLYFVQAPKARQRSD